MTEIEKAEWGGYCPNTIYNIDCMEGMKKIPDKFFDLALCDCPYGIGENGKKNYSKGKKSGGAGLQALRRK